VARHSGWSMMHRFAFHGLIAARLVGCQTLPTGDDAPRSTAVPATAPEPEQPGGSGSATPALLVSDMVFGVLAADIASQRGDYAVAQKHYMYAARVGRDAQLAELATKAALAAEDKAAAAEAVEFWLQLQADNVGALQIAALLAAEGGDRDLAVSYLSRAVETVRAQGGEGYIVIARLLAKIGKADLRVDLMRRLSAGREDDAEAMFALALVETGSGNHERAEAAVRRVLALKPEWNQARVLLVRLLGAQGRDAEARQVLERYLEDEPDDDQLRAAYARLLVDLEEYPAAKREFERLLESQPDDADTLFALGILAMQLQQIGPAEDYLRRLYRTGSHRDEAAYYLGQILDEEGEDDQALVWYGRVEDSNRFEARVRIARIYGERGDVTRARELVRQLRGRDGVEAAKLALVEAELLSDLKLYADAVDVLSEALSVDPDNHDLLYSRALTAVNIDRVDVLEQDLGRILSQDPDHADALNALGYTLADQTDRYQEALGYIQRALELKPDNAAVLDSMGWVQYRLGNRREALRYLWRAMAVLPDPEIASHLTEVLWEEGEQDRARQVWRDAMKGDPQSEFLLRVKQRYGFSR
jgi:tetratricopeptide (TPR) repeat protein